MRINKTRLVILQRSFLINMFLGSYICIVEHRARLTIENSFSVDLRMIYIGTSYDGESYPPEDLSLVHAQQTEKLTGISVMPKITLEAHDSSDNIVWKKSWTGEEFIKLKDVDWEITISP